jgi:HAD superfamily hydrolase (TIGR01548 family)
MKNNTLLVFDIDGTLVNTESSYLEAVRLTAEYFLQKEITKDDVIKVKMLSGFNNDWLATFALINASLTSMPIQSFQDEKNTKAKISFNIIKDVFQNYYLGEKRFIETENKQPILKDFKQGLWEKESLIFSEEKINDLYQKYGFLKIITGRTSAEAHHFLNHFSLKKFFDKVISVEDINDEWLKNFVHFQKYGKDKVNPILFYQIDDISNYSEIIYIGDSISDMQLAYNAQSFLPVKGIHFLETYPIDKISTINKQSSQFNPSHTFQDVSNLYSFLMK